MKTTSQLYQIARDIDGLSHCYINYYDPTTMLQVVFPGFDGPKHLDAFVKANCDGYTYRIGEGHQTLIIDLKAK